MPPVANDFTIFYVMRRCSRDLLAKTLLSKSSKFTASVVSTLAKLNKRTLVYESSPQVLEYTQTLLANPELLKNSSNYFRNYLQTDEEVERQHQVTVSNLRKHYLAMGLEKVFIEEIQSLLKMNSNDIERLIEKKRLESTLNIISKQEILEKYAILGHLVSNIPGMFIVNQLDYFNHTVFAPLFEGDSTEDIAQEFLEIDLAYKKRFTDMINEQIERISDYELLPPTRKSRTWI